MMAVHVESSRWWAISRHFLPEAEAMDSATLHRAVRLVLFSLAIEFWIFLFWVFFAIAKAPGCQVTAIALIAGIFANLWALNASCPRSVGRRSLAC